MTGTGVLSGGLKRSVLEVQEYMRLIGRAGRALVTRPIYVRDTVEQLDSLGVGSLNVVLLTGAFTGMVLALQSGHTLDQFGGRSIVGRLVSASMVKELGPVLTALMVAGRVGAGVAAELGSMAVTQQLAAMRALGFDPVRKLAVPRVVAITLMLPVLTIVSDAIGMLGGAVISTMQLGVPTSVYWNNVAQGLYMRDISMGLIKPVILGFVIGTVACHVGLRARGGTQGVGRATTDAVVAASALILAMDFFVTKLLIALMY